MSFNDMRNKRAERIAVSKETIEISKQGYYINSLGEKVNISAPKSHMIDLRTLEIKSDNQSGHYESKLDLIDTDTTSAIHQIKQQNPNCNLGVLNFASALNAGGGFTKGAMAQEEAICYCSNLYLAQLPMQSTYYTVNKGKDGLYTHNMFITDNVCFFKDNNYQLLNQPTIADKVLTVPAVNIKFVPTNLRYRVYPVMQRRIDYILQAFAQENCCTLLLGAFGCGAFGNNPKDIAEAFRNSLLRYRQHFDKIVFAIPDSPKNKNFVIFRNYLQI